MTDPRIFAPTHQPIVSTTTNSKPAVAKTARSFPQASFSQVLRKEINQVKFSQHAIQRLDARGIKLDEMQLERLRDAVDKAAQKGSRESLVLMDNELAFVVSVRNRTVITAMDGTSIKDNVFTNIDSTVIM